MRHLGDITKINGAEIEPVHCIIGGSPCQDLSIAGKRTGLSGKRSGLFIVQVRIVKEMRGKYGTAYPRFMVWENVPGAFSSNKGTDFAAVLTEIIRIAEPEAPDIEVPKKGWPAWGGYHDEVGGRWSVVWRTHDAQYWGVPQRRRRISVVADFGGDTATEIQFDRKSVSGDIAESGAPGEMPSGNAESGVNPAVADITTYCLQGNGIDRADTAGCNGRGWREDACYTLNTIDRPAVLCLNDQGGNVMGVSHDVTGALREQEHGHQPSILDMSHACNIIRDCGEVAPCLQTRMGTGGNQVPLTYQMQGFGDYHAGEVASSCKQRDFKDSTDLVCSVDCRNFREGGEINGTLQAKESGGQSLNLNNTIRQNMVARRLTPLECTRLQGYPDGWVDIGDWTDEKGKKHKDADSPKYKALGNTIALPFWDWMLRRMAWYLPEGATLGSLFDGIGGFPLIWERIHGRGTARWASEIEPFPIAVTKKHFPEEE